MRPFLLASAGIISTSSDTGDIEISSTLFGVTGGVGIHWFATESVSLSPTLSVGYSFGDTRVESDAFPAAEGDATIFSIGVGVMLAAWL